jgi:phage baseplate assembly protein W
MPDPTKDFLGSGWKFPPQLDAQGRIALVHQEEDIEEAIQMILRTDKGERPMRPEFGSELFRLYFAPNDAATGGLARRYVREALARWEPRIEVIEVRTEADQQDPNQPLQQYDPAKMLIHIRYRVRVTNSERNLVFPYYTIPGED